MCLEPKLFNKIYNHHFNEIEILGYGWDEHKPLGQHGNIK
jgi:hypothetical protein